MLEAKKTSLLSLVLVGGLLAVPAQSEAPKTETPPDRQGDETDKVMDLVEHARRLSEELLAVHQQIAQRLEDRGEALPSAAGGRASVKAGRSAPTPATAPAKNSNEWYMDFLD